MREELAHVHASKRGTDSCACSCACESACACASACGLCKVGEHRSALHLHVEAVHEHALLDLQALSALSNG